MISSYRLKASADADRPSGSLYPMGTFRQGNYHYHATDTHPFLQRCVQGFV